MLFLELSAKLLLRGVLEKSLMLLMDNSFWILKYYAASNRYSFISSTSTFRTTYKYTVMEYIVIFVKIKAAVKNNTTNANWVPSWSGRTKTERIHQGFSLISPSELSKWCFDRTHLLMGIACTQIQGTRPGRALSGKEIDSAELSAKRSKTCLTRSRSRLNQWTVARFMLNWNPFNAGK